MKDGLKTHEDSLAYVNKLKDIFAKDETNEVVLDGLNSMYSSLKMEKEQAELLDAAIAKNPNNFVPNKLIALLKVSTFDLNPNILEFEILRILATIKGSF
jgi:hypothetical protein